MPYGYIRNTDSPTAKLRTDVPTSRIGEPQIIYDNFIQQGSPIGLLLALTYANSVSKISSTVVPNARLRNTD